MLFPAVNCEESGHLSWWNPLISDSICPRCLSNPAIQFVNHLHDRLVPLGRVERGAEPPLLPLDLREGPERKFHPVLVYGAVGVLFLHPYVDADGVFGIADIHKFGDKLRGDAAGSDGRNVEADAPTHEVQVQVGHLPARRLPLSELDPGEISLDGVILPALLFRAHPLGKLALVDIKSDGTVGGIPVAGEGGVCGVVHGFGIK